MTLTKRACIGAAVALGAACAAATIQRARPLRYHFSPGQVDRYSVDVRVKVDADERLPDLNTRVVRGVGSTALRVLSVNPDGSARVRAEVQPLVIRGGRPDPSLAPQVLTLVMTPRGEAPAPGLVRGKAVAPKDLLVDPSALSRIGAALPAAPVKPGDRWSFEAPNPFQPAGKIAVACRYFADEKIRDIPSARIHQSMNIPIAMRLLSPAGGGAVRVHGGLKVNTAVHFAPSLGKVLRSSSLGAGTLRLTPVADRSGKESVAITLNIDAVSELISEP